MKKRIILVLLLLALVLGMAVSAEATVATKPITVDYADIVLFVNGNAITLQPDEEAFIYNGRTFVPIRFVSEALNQTVEWIDWLKAVKITGGADATSSAEKDQEIAALKSQITSLQNRIDYLEGDEEEDVDEDVDEQISDLEDELIDDYEYLENVEIDDIRLDGDEDDVDVEIDVDLEDYDDDWEDLDDGDIEDWLDDLVSDIQDEFSDDTVVTGDITDIDSDDVLVKFEKDGDEDLEVTFKDDDYRDGGSSSDDADDVIDSLEDEDYDVGGIDFSMTITYYEDDDRVSANLRAVYNDAESDWDALDDDEIESDVEGICEEIADAFEDDAEISLETIKIYFYDRDDNTLDSYNYDVDDGELD